MSQIQSSVGLITGLPILDTVDNLIKISARPRDMLRARTEGLKSQQLALSQITSLLLGLRFEVNKLNSSEVFQARQVTSSNSDAVSASLAEGATPPLGHFMFTPAQTASAQQLLSGAIGSEAPPSTLKPTSLRFGGFLDTDIPLERLGGGSGVTRGQIRIRNRSGASAVIDFRHAHSVDDILSAINSNADIAITARVEGDRIHLVDNTSQSVSNLIVQEVDGGTTAADLGLAGIDVASDTAVGQDILYLHQGTRLSHLNDGNGVLLHDGVADLEVTLRDGTNLQVDLGAAGTLGDVLDALNAADPAKFAAAISADGDRLELTDLTAGGGNFSVTNAIGSTAADDLGLDRLTLGGTLTGRRLQAGLKTTLLSSLNGGAGLGDLGTLELTDRSGQTAVVDLLPAETIDDVLAAINAAGIGIEASLDASRGGILLRDTTGDTSSNLIVASGDATGTAEILGIAVNEATDAVQSSRLNRQTAGHATRLDDFGGGVSPGSFVIRDSNGKEAAVRLNNPAAPITTVGGVIDAINALSIDVEARLNDRGDGLLLIDRAGGTETLSVREVGTGTTAADLRLLRPAEPTPIGGETLQAIDGTAQETFELARHLSLPSIGTGGVQLGKFTIRDSSGKTAQVALNDPDNEARTLGDVIDAINAADVAVEARVNDTGDGLLLVDVAGGGGALTVTDASGKTTAADLGIAGTASAGPSGQFIDGAGTFDSTHVDADALTRLVDEINGRGAGVSASKFFDGTSYRLALSATEPGAANELLIDSHGGALQFTEIAPARDALVSFGAGPDGGILLASPTGEFENIVDGVNIQVQAPSEVPVAVSVTSTDEDLLGAVHDFVDAYNSLRDNLAEVTSFDEVEGPTGTLFGSHEVLRIDNDVSRLASSHFRGLGRFESLESVGIELDQDGKLSVNETRLQEAFAEDPESLERLFTDADRGVAVQFEGLIDQLAGESSSLLTFRTESLADKIESNVQRIDVLDSRLESERARLLKQFFAIEEAVARMQSDLAAIQGIQGIAPGSISLGQR